MRPMTSTVRSLAAFVALLVAGVCGAAGQGNLLENGGFEGLGGWQKQHASNVADRVTVETRDHAVVWERTGSRNDGGLVGVYQDLDLDVSQAKSLVVSFEVRVDYHTLTSPGWWAEERGGSGEMPAKVSVAYLDAAGREYVWDHGFLADNRAWDLLWRNPDTGQVEPKRGRTTLRNFTAVPHSQWVHTSFDLFDDAVRRDGRAQAVLPRPARLKRIYLHGSGWDFKAAVANAHLRMK
jgi:hypothetical protein